MNETFPSRPEPIIEPDSATIVKWTGMLITVSGLLLLFLIYGWFIAMLAAIISFGTLMTCVGAESEAHLDRE